MQSTFVDITSYLQLCFAELPDHCIVVDADYKLTIESTTPTIGVLTLFLLVEHTKLSIAYLL